MKTQTKPITPKNTELFLNAQVSVEVYRTFVGDESPSQEDVSHSTRRSAYLDYDDDPSIIAAGLLEEAVDVHCAGIEACLQTEKQMVNVVICYWRLIDQGDKFSPLTKLETSACEPLEPADLVSGTRLLAGQVLAWFKNHLGERQVAQ